MHPAAIGRKMPEIDVARRFCYAIANTFVVGVETVAVIVVVPMIVSENNRITVKLVINTSISWVIIMMYLSMLVFL